MDCYADDQPKLTANVNDDEYVLEVNFDGNTISQLELKAYHPEEPVAARNTLLEP